MFKLTKFVIIFFEINAFFCNVFKDNSQIVVSPTNNTYFGYSLLLQKNFPALVIIGAPNHSDSSEGGALYQCEIPTGKCSRIKNIPVGKLTEGNWLGSVLDGEMSGLRKIFTCAPRTIRQVPNDYYMNGVCYEISSNGHVEELNLLQTKHQTHSLYYNNTFGELGLSTYYSEDTREFVMGAVGVLLWGGSIFVKKNSGRTLWLPYRTRTPRTYETFLYLGYSVYSAKFNNKSNEIWYVAGAPRSKALFGEVQIFVYDPTMSEHVQMTSYKGEEFGAYFGATVLVEDLNGDGLKDLLIAAPMAAGATWDEGYVIIYSLQNNKKFSDSYVKLTGSRSASGRFGSAMVSLGDVNLDGFNDIAISAPYENGGAGAVYIYKGAQDFTQDSYSQKLTPKAFSSPVFGFGLGLSKGCDINNDGYNDVAIGAYKSDLVFILESKPIVEFTLNATSSLATLSSDHFSVKFCLMFKERHATYKTLKLKFNTFIAIDSRGIALNPLNNQLLIEEDKLTCRFIHILFTYDYGNDLAFRFAVSAELAEQSSNFSAIGNQFELFIPVLHACGNDKICNPNILIVFTQIPRTNFVIGLTKTIEISLVLKNNGEAAYQCRLEIACPKGLELRNTLGCVFRDSIFDCPVADKFDNIISIHLVFDVDKINPELQDLNISFVVRSENYSVTDSLRIPTLLSNTPYIEGDSNVPTFEYNEDFQDTKIEMNHRFSILNSGPSPLKLQVYLIVPQVYDKKASLIDIVSVESYHNNIQTSCQISFNNFTNYTKMEPKSLQPQNRSALVNCFGPQSNCTKYLCDGLYLTKSSETANYQIKMLVKIHSLAKFFAKHFSLKDIFVFSSSALIANSTQIIAGHASTVIFFPIKKPIPIWIYVVSILGGLLLLLVIVFFLYKCQFFKRDLQDKLLAEKQQVEETFEEIEEDNQELNVEMQNVNTN